MIPSSVSLSIPSTQSFKLISLLSLTRAGVLPLVLYVAPPSIAVPYMIAYRLWTKKDDHKQGSGQFHPLPLVIHPLHTHTPLWLPNVNQHGGYTKSEPLTNPSPARRAPCLTLKIFSRSQLDFRCYGDALWYSIVSFFQPWMIFKVSEIRDL